MALALQSYGSTYFYDKNQYIHFRLAAGVPGIHTNINDSFNTTSVYFLNEEFLQTGLILYRSEHTLVQFSSCLLPIGSGTPAEHLVLQFCLQVKLFKAFQMILLLALAMPRVKCHRKIALEERSKCDKGRRYTNV